MKYHIQEATFDAPDGDIEDRTTNVLAIGNLAKPFSIVASRDRLEHFPDVEAFLKDQIKRLARKEKKFSEHQFTSFSIKNPHADTATETDTTGRCAEAVVSYTRPGHSIRQRILIINLPKRRVLAMNGTLAGVWTDSMESDWKKLLQSIELR
jgi:hypothetical protein